MSGVLRSQWVSYVVSGYPDDTFYHLTRWQRLGLATISSIGLATLVAASWGLTHWWQRWCHQRTRSGLTFNLLVVAIGFWMVLSVAPQLYYGYYRTVMPGLPGQWVVHHPLPLGDYLRLYAFPGRGPMADHFAALAAWVLLLNTLQQWLRYNRGHDN